MEECTGAAGGKKQAMLIEKALRDWIIHRCDLL
jgi:hypothetical protein